MIPWRRSPASSRSHPVPPAILPRETGSGRLYIGATDLFDIDSDASLVVQGGNVLSALA